jgi:hypothetical protein
MATDDRTWSVYWADLFLALLYSAAILLFVAWLGKWELKNPPETLVKIAGNAWAWVTTAAAGALVSFIFRIRLSWLTLIWTVFLTIALGVAIYMLRVPSPLPPEHWQVSEGGGSPMQWDVTYDGSAFSCPPRPGFSPQTLCTATGWGIHRAIHRYQAPTDGNKCIFFGAAEGDTAKGDYHCQGFDNGQLHWSATIARR